jgi:uncharacterized FlgJ-related protein
MKTTLKFIFGSVFKLALFISVITLPLFFVNSQSSELGIVADSSYIRSDEEVDTLFSKENLVKKIKSLDIKYPHIVYAQAYIESGNFKSKLFRTNHNLFGMREAKSRINLALGSRRGYAYYRNWEDSVLDYAFYMAYKSKHLGSEDNYYAMLSKSYAENPDYISVLKNFINKNNIKQLFREQK